MKKKNYVALHNHSHYSTLDGYATIDEYIKAALENDMIGIGLADHGTASGLYKFITRAQDAGLIPVPGVEFYVAPENKDGAKAKKPIYYGKGGRRAPQYDLSSGAYTHLTVFAYNNVGLRNLFKLTSLSWERQHFYMKPRIDTNMLAEHSEGLIVTTGCPSSEINKRFLLGQDDKAYEYANRLKSIFGDNFYVELMDHKMEGEELERIITPKLIELSKRLNIEPIITNDSHYAFKDDHKPHERILAVSTQSTMKEPRMSDGGKRFAFSTPEYYIKTYDEMKSLFPEEIAEVALANTIKLTEKCKDIKISYDPRLRPEIEIPEGHTPVSYLRELIVEGFNKKRGHQSEEIIKESIKRIREEFEVIHSNDFVSYFLVVHDYIDFAHKKGIGVGAGRGCFVPGTKVKSNQGVMRNIENIKVGDKVQTHDTTYQKVENLFIYDVEDEDMTRLTLSNGKVIESTSDHMIFHEQEGFMEAKDFSVGDVVLGPKGRREPYETTCDSCEGSIKIDKQAYDIRSKKGHYKPEGEYWCYDCVKGNLHKIPEVKEGSIKGALRNKDKDIKEKMSNTLKKHWEENYDERIQIWHEYMETPEYDEYRESRRQFNLKKYSDPVELEKLTKQGKSGYKSGYFTSHRQNKKEIYYASSYEQKALNILETSSQVANFDRYKGRVPYIKPSTSLEHNYLPDFMVEMTDGSTKVVEVKAKWQLSEIDTRVKLEQAEKHFNEQGIKFEVWDEDVLEELNDDWHNEFKIVKVEHYKYTGKVYDIQVENVHNYNVEGVTVHNSVGGSEIAYVLDISNTDPIRFDLLFERFLSPGRGSLYQIDYVTGESEEVAVSDKKRVYSHSGDKVVYVHELDPGDMVNYGDEKKVIEAVTVKQPGSAPDVDTDFHTEGREEVVQYCIDKYGEENVANIVTFGTFKARSGFKAMCTAYEVPFGAANNASKLIPGGQSGEASLKEIMDPASPRYNEGQDFRNATEDPVFEEVIEMASHLDGRISETGVHPCFTEGTLIKTDVGYKAIEKVKVGDNVLTHNNSYNQVVEVMKNNSSDLYELFTANSLPIQVTGNHPMYVREVVKDKSITKGKSARYLLEPKWKNVEDLSIENDLIGIPINNISIIPNLPYDLPFENKDFWWIMGRYVGDGWYEEFESKRNRKRKDGTPYVYTSTTKKICMSVGKEDSRRQELIDKMNSLFNIRVESGGKTADKIFIRVNEYPDLFEFLKLFGKYAHGKKIPEGVLNLPTDLLKEFLNGYISADGTEYDNNTFGFSTVSKELLLGMSSIVNKVYKKHCTVSVEKRDGTTMIIEGRKVNVRDRYGARFTTDKRLKERSFYEDGFLWVHISKLNKLELESTEVYNLSVVDDNSYTVNNLIAHNCGVIISNKPLAGTIPTQVRQDDGKVITQWEYPELEALGLIKMDLLGLELINTVQQSLENIRLTNDSAKSKEEIREIPNMKEIIQGEMDDPEVYKMLQEGNTVGIFQLGSPGVRQLLRSAKPENFMEIANITALYRPGPMKSGAHTQYADRKAGRESISYIHEDFLGTEVEEVLEETFGLMIFQEQIMRIAGRYAGMTPYETDRLRSAVGKKKMKIMMEMKPKFVEGCMKRGASQEAIDTLWETIEVFGQYGFNKSHSVSYALNIYESIYLKANYPSEFMAALIQQGIGNPNKVKSYIQEANRMRLRIGPVDINTSQVQVASTGISKDNKYDIVYGFSGVKQMNDITSEAIVKERNKNGPYTSIADLVKRLAKTNPITAAPLSNLALAGAFDSFGVSRKLASEKARMIIGAASNQASKGTSLFEMMGGSGNDVAEAIELEGEEFSYNEKIKKEADSIGMFVSGHPTSKLGHIAKMYNPTTFEKVLSSNSGRKTFNVLGTITQMVAKTNRAGNRSVAMLMDDGHEAVASYMPRKLVDAIEKGEEIKRFRKAEKKGTSIKKDRRYDRAIRLMNDENIIPIEPFETNDPYLFEVTVRGWGENAKISVLNVTKLETAPDGSLPYEINALSIKAKKLIQDTIKQFEDKNGSYVKVNLKDGTSSFLKTKVKLSLDFIMAMEKIVGKKNIVTEGI